jgi:hypothetical protein
MKTLPIILGACFVVLCVAAAGVVVAERRATLELQKENQRLQSELRTAQSQAGAVLAEKEETVKQLAHVQSVSDDFKARIAEVESAKAEADTGVPVVTPYQAQAFLGQKPLGWVWIIPQNLRKDTNTQRYVYEPVVWLDEGLRKQFVTHHTNVVEREVETKTYVNSTYYPQPAYYYSYPVYPIPRPPPGSNCPPPVVTPPTAPPSIQPVPKPFNPGNGTITAQRLGTPAGAIKTKVVR